MLEVAAVASYICDNVKKVKVNKKAVVEWALLHDMGNIVKFRKFISPQMEMGEKYWRKVQKKFIEKYGKDAHYATLAIIKEMSLKNEGDIIKLISGADFREIANNGYTSMEIRICDYADMSVSPRGIVGFKKRVDDLIKRYNLTSDNLSTKARKENALEIDKHFNGEIENIHKHDFSDLIKELSEYDISLKV